MLLERRLNSMPDPADRERYLNHFDLEKSLRSYREGTEMEPLVIFSERQSGRKCFVKYSASMRRDPMTGKPTIFGIETVAAALEDQESYSVDVTCEIDGEIFYKRFMFYAVDASVNFYVLLKSDYTAMQAARNEQLKTALEEARQANVAKTAFLSNMSHEIRTPMNAIIGLDNIALNEDDLSPKTREHLEQIGVSTRQLLGLIKDILDMSRIESGRIVLSAESVATFEDKSTLRFTVSDTGIGIDRNYLPRLFEAFSQENIANTSRYGGLGLGLALTKNIVEIMNGSITVESEKHKGPSCCSRRRQHL